MGQRVPENPSLEPFQPDQAKSKRVRNALLVANSIAWAAIILAICWWFI
jgi:hypothetical protein